MDLRNSNSCRLRNIGKSSTSVLMSTVNEIVDAAKQKSVIFKPSAIDRVPRFESRELNLGRVLGRGGFCVVSELSGIKLSNSVTTRVHSRCGHVEYDSDVSEIKDSTNSTDENDADHNIHNDGGDSDSGVSREAFARHLVSKKTRRKSSRQYVVKKVSNEIKLRHSQKAEFLKATVDLCMEAQFLANLHHPNIIKLRGAGGTEAATEDGLVFLVLDRVTETFASKLKHWMNKDRRTKGLIGCFAGGQKKVEKLLVERLQASFDIANAMAYLHSKNVIYRDLKPDNIGFDAFNNLKIFDFGLAKELRVEEQDKDGLYRLTGFTGAVRYMAPEVGLQKNYNLKADVYSWSMLMWYILALEPPFPYYTLDMFPDRVFRKGTRPAIKYAWPVCLQNLLKISWQANIQCRPNFQEIKDVLRSELCIKDISHRTLESTTADNIEQSHYRSATPK